MKNNRDASFSPDNFEVKNMELSHNQPFRLTKGRRTASDFNTLLKIYQPQNISLKAKTKAATPVTQYSSEFNGKGRIPSLGGTQVVWPQQNEQLFKANHLRGTNQRI